LEEQVSLIDRQDYGLALVEVMLGKENFLTKKGGWLLSLNSIRFIIIIDGGFGYDSSSKLDLRPSFLTTAKDTTYLTPIITD
jgi:hypothetical protein